MLRTIRLAVVVAMMAYAAVALAKIAREPAISFRIGGSSTKVMIRGGVGGAGGTTSAGNGGEVHLVAGNAGGVVAGGLGANDGWGGEGEAIAMSSAPVWNTGGGSVRISGGHGLPPGDIHFQIDSIDRLWIDSAGVAHYNGAELANRADVDGMIDSAGVSGFAGALVGTSFALLCAWVVRRSREAAWRAAQDRSPDEGPYRGTNTHGPL